PGIEDNRMRRSAWPSVCPKPRSRGSRAILARLVPSSSTSMTRGTRKSLTALCIDSTCSDKTLGTLNSGLLGVELHDQALVDVGGELTTIRMASELTFQLVRIHADPGTISALCCPGQSLLNAQLLGGPSTHRDHVPGLHLVGGNVDRLAVD